MKKKGRQGLDEQLDAMIDEVIKANNSGGFSPEAGYTIEQMTPTMTEIRWCRSSNWDCCAGEAFTRIFGDGFVGVESDDSGCDSCSCGYGCGQAAEFRIPKDEVIHMIGNTYRLLQRERTHLVDEIATFTDVQTVMLDKLLQDTNGQLHRAERGTAVWPHGWVQLADYTTWDWDPEHGEWIRV